MGKLLEGRRNVLEVGCGDGFFTRIVRQHLSPDATLQAVDVSRVYIGSFKENNPKEGRWRCYPGDWDILQSPLSGFEAVYCLDLFEHIEDEDRLLKNLSDCAPVCVIGCPSLESQAYASPISKLEHVNCKTREGLRQSMQKHFKQVFIFGMTDTVIHNGPHASYLFGLGINA